MNILQFLLIMVSHGLLEDAYSSINARLLVKHSGWCLCDMAFTSTSVIFGAQFPQYGNIDMQSD
jgi:hypothetical protein